jgi:flagellar biosynthesis protein FlhA
MDGASKFVRGDAVAGLIITAINIIGGLIIGAVQFGMPIAESAQRFTILTVGDGLVSQIPSLIVSTAAGIVVTRAGEIGELSGKLFSQLFKNSRIMALTGGALLLMSIVPGLPKISFWLLSGLLFYLSYIIKTKVKKDEDEPEEETESEEISEEDEVKNLLEMDLLELEIGFNLIPLVDAGQGGTLLSRIKAIRKQIALEMGFLVPPVRIRDNLQIEPTSYVVLIKGVKVVTGFVFPDKYLVMNPDGDLDNTKGIDTKEPAFGLPAKWVDEMEKEKAELEGYTIVDPTTVIVTHLMEIIKSNAFEFIGRQETQELLDKLKERFPKLVEDLVPNILDLGIVQRVLQNLLKEKVSIRNLQTILEVLASYGVSNKDVSYLTEKVRLHLKRQITQSLVAADNTLYVFTLSSQVEQLIAQNLQKTDDGNEIVMDPSIAQKILQGLNKKVEEITAQGISPVIVVSPPIRLPFRKFIEKFIPNITVISHNEISESVRVESLGVAEIEL